MVPGISATPGSILLISVYYSHGRGSHLPANLAGSTALYLKINRIVSMDSLYHSIKVH
jgi:hypothetical protein